MKVKIKRWFLILGSGGKVNKSLAGGWCQPKYQLVEQYMALLVEIKT